MKPDATPSLSSSGRQELADYEFYLREQRDISPVTVRNYLSDLRSFIAWYETKSINSATAMVEFDLTKITTPTLTRYRSYLQSQLKLAPASINRYLVTLKSYFALAVEVQKITTNPATVVKLIPLIKSSPCQISDGEESAIVSAVTNYGSMRDRTIIILMFHTGLRAAEVCQLKTEHIHLRKRSGYLQVYGKRNKYRKVPLNATVRKVLVEYLTTVGGDWLFISRKTKSAITTRGLAYLVSKYARIAGVEDISPHDLRHRFGYRIAETVPLHRLAQIMGHDSLDTTMVYVRGTSEDLQRDVEHIAWQ
ncbi:MAG: tyrosine-type recombinase/integrase [Pleurocapsa sp. SU_5_0]|nr:tyrosine-type recombinase/integrase [Pleurocapsa sp. SU_5_0]NJO98871.1 tyrosine-type recombinase/integrase [Pleurocapsa sp. CRU_1_2]